MPKADSSSPLRDKLMGLASRISAELRSGKRKDEIPGDPVKEGDTVFARIADDDFHNKGFLLVLEDLYAARDDQATMAKLLGDTLPDAHSFAIGLAKFQMTVRASLGERYGLPDGSGAIVKEGWQIVVVWPVISVTLVMGRSEPCTDPTCVNCNPSKN